MAAPFRFAAVVVFAVAVSCLACAQTGTPIAETKLNTLIDRAEKGDMQAEFYLGLLYDHGKEVPANPEAAVRWYQMAADRGDHSAQNNLGALYMNGRGVPKDLTRAALWY